MRLPKQKSLISNARNLRRNATKEENHLWYDFLSNHPVRFRHQEIIGRYIADFYCDKSKLVIELDGGQHYEQKHSEYDCNRTEYFKSLGIKVIRFTNIDIRERFEGVCYMIDQAVNIHSDDASTLRGGGA